MAKKRNKPPKVSNDVYAAEIFQMQTELVKLQEWTRQTGARILVIFEDGTRPARWCDQADH